MIEISGDMFEGGGQIIRTSTALAALAGKQVRITKIRNNRPKPGLQAQHLTALKALAAMCNAKIEGLFQGSQEISFMPTGYASGKFNFDVGTAGSIPLILQALMPSAAYAPSQVELNLTGGTDVKWSPTIDYTRLVALPVLELMGYDGTITLHQRGHYPKGGGKVSMKVNPPRVLKSIRLSQKVQPSTVEGISHCVMLPSHVAQRQAASAKNRIHASGYREVNIAIETYPPERDPHLGPGSGITLLTKNNHGSIMGADSIGERGKPAEQVGEEAASRLLREISSQASVDSHMGDIIIPYMAVAEGLSEIYVSEITMHTITNIRVTELIVDVKFEMEGELHMPGKIRVEGIGLNA